MSIEQEVRLLKGYALLSSLVLAVIVFLLFRPLERQRFVELDVERINVVEPDHRLRMVISNRDRAPDPILDGRALKRQGGNPPGIIFFNDEGDERGGLVYGNAGVSLNFDKYKQGELLRLTYSEDPQGSSGGFMMLDRPNQPPTASEVETMAAEEARLRSLPAPERQAAIDTIMDNAAEKGETLGGAVRVFAGKTRDGLAVLDLSDAVGRPRLRLAVTAQGAATLQFLDERGRVLETVQGKR